MAAERLVRSVSAGASAGNGRCMHRDPGSNMPVDTGNVILAAPPDPNLMFERTYDKLKYYTPEVDNFGLQW